ncbi:MAG: transcription repressor NadR [Bacillota bacterium]
MSSLSPEKRRNKISSYLEKSNNPVTGSDLAEKFQVTRQVIVQDIALLRAANHKIISTSQGYIYQKQLTNGAEQKIKATIACRHQENMTEDELLIMINHGARIIDVRVEHPLYGELIGNLMLTTAEEVKSFLKKVENNQAELLSKLTHGIHLHTVEVPNNAVLNRMKEALAAQGYLLED